MRPEEPVNQQVRTEHVSGLWRRGRSTSRLHSHAECHIGGRMHGHWSRSTPGLAAILTPLIVHTASCALGQRTRFQEPEVQLATVQVTGIGFTGGSLNIQLEVTNPNGYEIRTTRVAARLDLEETHFGEAVLDRHIVLPAESRTLVDVPVRFTWEGVGAGARALLGRGTVNYLLASQITLDTPLGDRTLQLENGGVVPLRELIR